MVLRNVAQPESNLFIDLHLLFSVVFVLGRRLGHELPHAILMRKVVSLFCNLFY